MNLAYKVQNFQDRLTQQWVIVFGKKINSFDYPWLIGPFGELNGIGEKFIYQLAEKENLKIVRDCRTGGLLNSITSLNLSEIEIGNLSESIISFYENTAKYKLKFKVKWNSKFLIFGYLINRLFSNRINQFNIPTHNIKASEVLTSEIIQLFSKENSEIKYTIWLRKFESTGKVIYSGIYTTCILPKGNTCIKAIFPLPKGNATVILKPTIGKNKEFILDSSGKDFGDAGFYFLLTDSKGFYWSKYIKSFTDKLIVSDENETLKAKQTLSLWGFKVATFDYEIVK